MKTHTVEFLDIDSVFLFTKLLEQYISSDVNAYSDRFIVDGKSFLCMINISNKPVKVEILSNDEKEIQMFDKICNNSLFRKDKEWNNGL